MAVVRENNLQKRFLTPLVLTPLVPFSECEIGSIAGDQPQNQLPHPGRWGDRIPIANGCRIGYRIAPGSVIP